MFLTFVIPSNLPYSYFPGYQRTDTEMSGRGRGDLIRRLLEQGSSNSESIGSDDNTSDSLGRGTRTTEAQRNVFTATEGASTPSTESLRPMGRAKLLALAQSRTVTTDIGTLSEGEGTSRGSPTRQLAVRIEILIPFRSSLNQFYSF